MAAKACWMMGCGPSDQLAYLDPGVGYIGVDLSVTAIEQARGRFGDRPATEFHVADFRQWMAAAPPVLDGVVWAGIGCTWTRRGRGGNLRDWLDILELAERPLGNGGILIFELVTPHWPSLAKLVEGRYEYLTGCDVDCFQSEVSPRRF